jgi:tRNA threonylcarbamoyladenosine biosynthesis protein TsaB
MRLLAIDAALGPAVAAIADDGHVAAEGTSQDAKGLAVVIAGLPLDGLDAVAVTVGPGSFTGLRAALALAQGFSLARGIQLIPVTVAEAIGEALPHLGGRTLWVAIDSRRDRLFLDQGQGMRAVALSDLPRPDRKIAIAGDAAREVAASLAATGADVMLTDVRHPRARDVARAAVRRLAGEWAALAAVPLYVDPPAARLPA